MSDLNSISTSAARIDALCDLYEAQWRSGSRFDPRDLLDQCHASDRHRLFNELLNSELDLRARVGEPFDWADCFQKFPEFEEQITTVRFQRQSSVGPQETVDLQRPQADRIEHFKLLEKVGQGSSGTVWKARDQQLQRTVAIKVSNNTSLDEKELGRFLREAQTVARLQHSGIVTVFQTGVVGNSVYIVSDFVVGQNLRTWLDENQPTFHQAAEICCQIAESLDYAHSQGVVHRDIKPANILIDGNGRIQITDFGLAKQLSSHSSISAGNCLIGTPAYMSPEQACGEGHRADARSDVYSLGVLLYEMLARQTPFTGSFEDVIKTVLTTEPPRLRRIRTDIPIDLELICAKAMARDPADRYQSASELADDCCRFLEGKPAKSRTYRRLSLTFRRSRYRLQAAVLVLACITIGFGVAVSAHVLGRYASSVQIRSVRINTIPPGAKVVFVPLSEEDQPLVAKKIIAPGTTPLDVHLLPGNYIVEAVLRDGSYQQVRRRVPHTSEKIPDSNKPYREWKEIGSGALQLADVHIPSKVITENMILVKPLRNSSDGDVIASPYYVDINEVTIGEYMNVVGKLPTYSPANSGQSDQPVALTYEDAVVYAELASKRLPSVSEWKQAQSVLSPRTLANLAEWTSNVVLSPVYGPTGEAGGKRLQIVCGATQRVTRGEANLSSDDFSIDACTAVNRAHYYPMVGLRCVRDEHPEFQDRSP